MPPQVKLSLRQRQAELTRSACLEAARELFASQGYVATTMEQIAAHAGVGVSTLYAVFGTKSRVLAEIRWRAVSLAEIPDLEALIQAGADAPQRIRAVVARMRRLYESAADVFAVQRAAAEVDPALAENWAAANAERRDHMRRILEPVAPQLALPLDRAADVVDAMIGFYLYEQLVSRSGWSPAEYEEWLAAAVTAQLAPAP